MKTVFGTPVERHCRVLGLAVAITFASLLVNQIAYLIGAWLRYRSTTEQSDGRNGSGR